jgi:hypothetical protein
MSEPSVSTPVGRAPVIPLILAGIGAYLAWFGVHYFKSDVKWPTDPLKDILQGKGLPSATGTPTATQAEISSALTAQYSGQQIAGAVSNQVGPAGSAPSVSGTYSLPELEALWTSQGGSSETAFEAANVANAESGGNPDATSANPDGGTNAGLWQLDTNGVGAGYTVGQLKDPATSARITVMHTANGTNWSEWADAVVVNGVYVGPKV